MLLLQLNLVLKCFKRSSSSGCFATNATFKITDTKLYVPAVTLSTEDDINFKELSNGINADQK